MSSDVVTPDPSSTDSSKRHADSIRPKLNETDPQSSSADEIAWDAFLGQAPDPMLEPLKSSSDDLGRMIAQAQPDPMLASQVGEFGQPATKNASKSFDDAAQDEALDAEDPIAAFSSIRTDAPLVSPSDRKARANKDRQQEEDEEDEGDIDAPTSGSSYAIVLLASYAVILNDLEITPLELREGPVELERTLAERKTRQGGKHALKLKIRFRNASQSAIFAPLDEGFIRERLRADPESFIESASGESIIAMFPLAVDSEWSITGQEFRELRPSESFESLIVSEPKAMDKLAPEMVWRIHLRTGIDQLGDFGLTFRPADIKLGK